MEPCTREAAARAESSGSMASFLLYFDSSLKVFFFFYPACSCTAHQLEQGLCILHPAANEKVVKGVMAEGARLHCPLC